VGPSSKVIVNLRKKSAHPQRKASTSANAGFNRNTGPQSSSRTEYDLTEDRDNRGPRWKLPASNAASANLILHKFRVANPEYGCEQLRENRAVSPAVHEPEQNHAPPATEP
jgi:hypothetical protein